MSWKVKLRKRTAVTLITVAAMAITALPSAAGAAPALTACDTRTNNTYAKILECVRVEGVRAHQAALQAAADANNGTRAAGTEGYTDSVAYVVTTLEEAR